MLSITQYILTNFRKFLALMCIHWRSSPDKDAIDAESYTAQDALRKVLLSENLKSTLNTFLSSYIHSDPSQESRALIIHILSVQNLKKYKVKYIKWL